MLKRLQYVQDILRAMAKKCPIKHEYVLKLSEKPVEQEEENGKDEGLPTFVNEQTKVIDEQPNFLESPAGEFDFIYNEAEFDVNDEIGAEIESLQNSVVIENQNNLNKKMKEV